MSPSRPREKFEAWLDQIHDSDDEFAYRSVYAAYLYASGGRGGNSGEAEGRRRADGGFEIRAGRETIVLADDAERETLAAHMVRRYCGNRYPDMQAWERQQHEWYVADLRDWT
ncbi:hypothetical protein FNH05_08795 [Amycolatopsis rhizosphaerae]|uniref:Uncharacterized protein n=1 Tax=Amycolatopsis rhizosphaerae TaxID=2053003 RepID=A0A558D4Z6_9PSEU|nr:hypothetical protein [Amycolatopsis rhizosphaerae]TVT56086.1 hypothetical protein FNH05_08795 [Amycolatopsis rhizosphaerae]